MPVCDNGLWQTWCSDFITSCWFNRNITLEFIRLSHPDFSAFTFLSSACGFVVFSQKGSLWESELLWLNTLYVTAISLSLFRNVPPLECFLVCALVVMDQYKPSLVHMHHTSFCMACICLSFESGSPVVEWSNTDRYGHWDMKRKRACCSVFYRNGSFLWGLRFFYWERNSQQWGLRMSLRNSRQECLKECLKGNQSYLFIGLFELEWFPHALLPSYLWLDICVLCSFPQSRVSQQLKSSLFLTFPFLDTCSHACLVCSKWVCLTAVFPFMLNVSFARNPTPVATGHASYILLLKLLLEYVPPMRLLTLAIYRLKIKVNTIEF